jgi:hypothetical protein
VNRAVIIQRGGVFYYSLERGAARCRAIVLSVRSADPAVDEGNSQPTGVAYMKSRICSAALLGIALLMSAAASFGGIQATAITAAARAGSAEFAVAAGMAHGPIQRVGFMLKVVHRTRAADSLSNGVVSSLSTFVFEPLQPRANDGDDHDRDDRHAPGPSPGPEPSTALLFGTAMLIVGGVLRRRLHQGQKLDRRHPASCGPFRRRVILTAPGFDRDAERQVKQATHRFARTVRSR